MPSVTRRVGNGDQTTHIYGGFLSPDGTQFAYLTVNPNNKPASYVGGEMPGPGPANVLSVTTLATGQTNVVAQAGKGQALGGDLAWSVPNPAAPSGNKIYFTGGNFLQTSFIVKPNLYSVDATVGGVAVGPMMTDDVKENVQGLLLCNDSQKDFVYFTASKDTGDPNVGSKMTLYVMPLGQPTAKKALLQANSIEMLYCIPPTAAG
jgi:hypothetical protein